MVKLLLGIHNHQPVGNFPEVFEKAYRMAYAPFVEVLARHPGIKMTVHGSGPLWEWLEACRPEYLDRLKVLVGRGQVELLGGAFYEAVLTCIPERDQRGQLEKMRDYIESRFGARPRGLWLAERVWEPQLAKTLAKAGVEYTIVDDTHFLAVGFRPEELRGHFRTEAEGHALDVFPISQRLRYMIPYSEPREVLDYLRGLDILDGKGGAPAAIMADDGEKFGLWPGTYDRIYRDGWLEAFLSAVEQNADWLGTATFSEYLDLTPARGWAYLPTSSYFELSEWALPARSAGDLAKAFRQAPESGRQFVRGGFFRNFLSKYPESARLYRKMLRVSRGVHRTGSREARERLWAGQCNCAYWHGVFGGLYLPHLRDSVYENLLKAESLADKARKADGFVVGGEDWDGDGAPEVLVESRGGNWYFAPRRGGGLWEWDVKPEGVNLLGVMGRRREAYHAQVLEGGEPSGPSASGGQSIHDIARAVPPGLREALVYDWHDRMSLLDHFLHPDTRLEGWASAQYGEQGDFILGTYEGGPRGGGASKARREREIELVFERTGGVWADKEHLTIRVVKRIRLREDGSWGCVYSLSNLSGRTARVWFGSELVFAARGRGMDPVQRTATDRHEFTGLAQGLGVSLRLGTSMDLWGFPLYTVSQSEGGFEQTLQGAVYLVHRKLELPPHGEWGLEMSLDVVRSG